MQGRTYRYFKGDPLYPFGFGLSYTKFKYDDLKMSAKSIKIGDPESDVRGVIPMDGIGAAVAKLSNSCPVS